MIDFNKKDIEAMVNGAGSGLLSKTDQDIKNAGMGKSELGKMAVHETEGMAGQGMTKAIEAMTGRSDPDGSFNFYVEIDGIRCASFRSASGLEWSMEVESFYQGGENRHKVNLIGKGAFSALKLKKGFFSAISEFYNWMKHLMDPGGTPIKRATISVVILADDGQKEGGRFNLYNAFMNKYTGPALDAGTNDIAFEEVEIHYDYFEYVPGGGAMGAFQKHG